VKLRARLLVAVLATIGLVLGGLTASFNLVLAQRLGNEATHVAQARATAELQSLSLSRGSIVLPETPDQRIPDTLTWVFQGRTLLEGPQLRSRADATAAALAQRAPATADFGSIRLYALPVAASRRPVGAVVAAVSLAPYNQSRRTALVGSVMLALAALVAVGIVARWVIGRALRPVALMTGQAADWSERDLERRFARGAPRDELTQLAFTLDGLLDRLSASLRHEQRLSAELSHELRTPLASIAAEAQYALRHTHQTPEGRAALEQIVSSTRQMGATLETLIAAARGRLDPHRATSDATACAQSAASAYRQLAAANEVDLTVKAPPSPVRVAVEQPLVERILGPILENACTHAARQVRVEVTLDDGAVLFAIEDDGPGIAPSQRDAIFEPGRRLTDHHGAISGGAGLGLALSRRLARGAAGDVGIDSCATGARFTIRLPAVTSGTMSLVAAD
jgi:signal transduction histidine kinase